MSTQRRQGNNDMYGELTNHSARTIRARETFIEETARRFTQQSIADITDFVDILIREQLVSDRFFDIYGG